MGYSPWGRRDSGVTEHTAGTLLFQTCCSACLSPLLFSPILDGSRLPLGAPDWHSWYLISRKRAPSC